MKRPPFCPEAPMLTLPFAAALSAAVISTSFLSGIFGMAGGMLLMGILLLLMPFAAAMVLHGVTQMASNLWRAWLWRSQHRVADRSLLRARGDQCRARLRRHRGRAGQG